MGDGDISIFSGVEGDSTLPRLTLEGVLGDAPTGLGCRFDDDFVTVEREAKEGVLPSSLSSLGRKRGFSFPSPTTGEEWDR